MASGLFSSVLGGHDNTASGDYSVAVGKKVRVSHANAAAIGLAPSLDTSCESVADSSLNICAENGLYVNGVLVDMEGVAALLQQQVLFHCCCCLCVGHGTSVFRVVGVIWRVLCGNGIFTGARHRGFESSCGRVAGDIPPTFRLIIARCLTMFVPFVTIQYDVMII